MVAINSSNEAQTFTSAESQEKSKQRSAKNLGVNILRRSASGLCHNKTRRQIPCSERTEVWCHTTQFESYSRSEVPGEMSDGNNNCLLELGYKRLVGYKRSSRRGKYADIPIISSSFGMATVVKGLTQ